MPSRIAPLSLVLALAGCVGTGNVAEDAAGQGAAQQDVVEQDGPRRAARLEPVKPLALPKGPNPLHYNVSFETSNVAEAAIAARTLIQEKGAEVINFSNSDQSANVQARAERGQCGPIAAALQTSGLKVLSASANEDNRNASIRQHQTRLRRLRAAQRELMRWSRGVSDPEAQDGLALLHQLVENDRQGQENQLAHYAEQGNFCRIYADFRKPVPVVRGG